MKIYAAIGLVIMLSGCASSATSSQKLERDTAGWADTIVGCQTAAELAGTDSDKAIWAFEKRALISDRNGGWPSDIARLNKAAKANKQQLLKAGDTAVTQRLAQCHRIVSLYFPEGHPKA